MTIRTENGQEPMDDLRQLETPADNTEPVIETRERAPEAVEKREEAKPAIQYGTPADRKRNEINERRQREQDERGAKIERSDETERMMGGHNLQTRADREAAAAAAKAQEAPQIKPEDIPAPRRITLKVHGEDREVDEDQVKDYAQIALASQDLLNQAKQAKREAQEELAELRRLRADHSTRQEGQPEPAQTKAEDTKPATDEELDSLIEAIQTGEIEDARKALQKHGDQIGQQVEKRILERIGDIDQRIAATTRRQQEDARVHQQTEQVITSFLADNDDFSSKPMMARALIDETVEVMRESLRGLNVKDETIAEIARTKRVAPQVAVGMAMQELRKGGYELPSQAEVMAAAAKRVRDGFGLPGPTPRREANPTPEAKVDPTSSILAARDARKQAMDPQPRRANVTPGPDLSPAKSKEELAREHIRAVKVSRRRY